MFRLDQPVLFRHCDPAGIVFYPRYFEMMNDCVEAFFADVVAWSFQAMHNTAAVPTAEIKTRFVRPSRHGDYLVLSLAVTRVGTSSCGLAITATCGKELRFETESTLVHVNSNGKPVAWPDPIRERLTNYKESLKA